MNCPSCKDVVLTMAERSGVEIDYCPKCRGIWLDRGELDKLLERAAVASGPVASAPMQAAAPPPVQHQGYPQQPMRRRDDSDDLYPHEYAQKYPHGKPYKKKSWLGEILDF